MVLEKLASSAKPANKTKKNAGVGRSFTGAPSGNSGVSAWSGRPACMAGATRSLSLSR
jgi:hypothetical protein